MSALIKKGSVNRSSSLASLCPYMHNGLMRIGGRLGRSTLSLGSKHQVIIPRNHRLGKLIIYDFHGATHVGVKWLLARILQKCWIIGAGHGVTNDALP